ncbi:heparinase [Bacillus sp. AFS006103]|nr:heparinase [Bacillus sp. AFS006103]
MSLGEVIWRLKQKGLENSERRLYMDEKKSIVFKLYNPKLASLSLDADKLGLNLDNKDFSLINSISLFGIYSYEEYRKEWHAGFQTNAHWPLEFSYDLKYKQCDHIGDARTNWELNRHFQFAILAKGYYASEDHKFLDEFIELFDDWNNKNPFLFGISWTSVMEIAIRINSWIFSYCFLKKSKGVPEVVLEKLRIGILNMTDYVVNHYSRFSSANNHLIVEAYVIGLSGILFENKFWQSTAINILNEEIIKQNYSDGINKELSLHYQTFFMEAVGLLIHVMQFNHITVPDSWLKMMNKMSEYVSNCMGNYGEVIVFGDNDEGKILDLNGHGMNHYKYILDLMSCILDKRYTNLDKVCENIRWLYSNEELDRFKEKTLYKNENSISYKEGGNSILRSNDGRMLIGIDHAALGFGSIAAHGHADALSFQMFVDGYPIFVDPGTYIYHIRLEERNYFRRTVNHNTISIDGRDQSEMLGAFLWGKRANSSFTVNQMDTVRDSITCSHDGYFPVIHQREFDFNKVNCLVITDSLDSVESDWDATFVLAENTKNVIVDLNRVIFEICNLQIQMDFDSDNPENININKRDVYLSKSYGNKQKSIALEIHCSANVKYLKTRIMIITKL